MEIIETVAGMRKRASGLKREGKTIGFVPTMGYLHAGHTSLMRVAREKADILAVSIFVNPTQFGPDEDLEDYPRDFKRDEEICDNENVDIIFYPKTEELYPPDYSVYADEKDLSQGLCGRSRPTHFRGVCTVVAKLFNIVQPDIAVFGRKDYQQWRVLERMARDLNFPVKILSAPIVREADGLAVSSRNQYLNPKERSQALCLRKALDLAEHLYAQGETSPENIESALRDEISQNNLATIDYIEIVDAKTLERVEKINRASLVALAVFIGQTRLIDNTVIAEEQRHPNYS